MDGPTVRIDLKAGQRYRLPSGNTVEVMQVMAGGMQDVALCAYLRRGALVANNQGAGRLNLTQYFLDRHGRRER